MPKVQYGTAVPETLFILCLKIVLEFLLEYEYNRTSCRTTCNLLQIRNYQVVLRSRIRPDPNYFSGYELLTENRIRKSVSTEIVPGNVEREKNLTNLEYLFR